MGEYLDGGVLTQGSLGAWQNDSIDGFTVVEDGPYALWLEDNGLDPNSEDLDFVSVLGALQEGISPYFNQTLSCPNLMSGFG